MIVTTVAHVLEGIPSWEGPLRGVCGPCAQEGVVPVGVLVRPEGTRACVACLGPLECLRCPEDCDQSHGACQVCGYGTIRCPACRGTCDGVRGCVLCHGHGRVREEHCCTCKRAIAGCMCVSVGNSVSS